MENSVELDTETFVTTTAKQDTGLCPQTRHVPGAIGTELEYLLTKYLSDNGDIT
ncbi:hypothetical protein ACWKXN_19825 [Enterobacter sp. UPMP2060]